VAPILAPTLPRTNVAFNVGLSTLRIIKQELARGMRIAHGAIERGEGWEALFESVLEAGEGGSRLGPSGHSRCISCPYIVIMSTYSNYSLCLSRCISIAVTAPTASMHIVWLPWVTTRLRFLVQSLEGIPGARLRPYPVPPQPDVTPTSPRGEGGTQAAAAAGVGPGGVVQYLYLGLDFESDWAVCAKPRRVKLSPLIDQFVRSCRSLPQLQPGMDISVSLDIQKVTMQAASGRG